MNNDKHTPGPWRYDSYWSLIHGPKGVEIAAIHSAQFAKEKRARLDTALANARLISAAPELLDALELAQATIERLHRHAPGSAQGTLDVIGDAISKATGSSAKFLYEH